MSTQLKLRRGTTAQHSTFTGASGEITVDTDKKTVVVHDGATAGGVPLLPKTMTDGTANGVAYLNGSKVLTTGSALTFDGTKLSLPTVLAIKGAQNSNLARIAMTRTDASYSINNETDLRFYGQTTDTESPANILHSMNTGGTFVWNNGSGSEQMRLTSTGLGIGTSSPGAKLEVSYADSAFNPGIRVTNTANTSASQAKVYAVNNAGDYVSLGRNSTVLGGQSAIFSTGAYPLEFFTNSTLRATLDSSGNLGLGVTPSAWSVLPAIQVSDYGGLSAGGGYTRLSSNAFLSTYPNTWSYINSTHATLYEHAGGIHAWFTAPSGTAGNAISFTQAMTLDAGGNLLVGTTTNSGNSDGGSTNTGSVLEANGTFTSQRNNDSNIFLSKASGYSSGTYVQFYVAGSSKGSISTNGTSVAYNTSSDYRLKNITGPITTSGAYIDSLNPVEGTWKADGSTFVGLIAHEVQEASRTQVATGEKDGEQMQGMDYSSSEIIANLIAELQSVRKRLAALEAA